MNPTESAEWVKAFGPVGAVLAYIFYSIRARTPDNPPQKEDQHEKLVERVTALELAVGILKDRSERT